jgi:hypothetical protein
VSKSHISSAEMSGAKLHAPLFTYDGSDCGFSANELDLSFFSEYLMDHDDSVDKNGYGSFLGKLYTSI